MGIAQPTIFFVPNLTPADLIERMESRHSLRQLSYMKEMGMGNNRYKLIDLDNEDAVIDAAAAVDGVVPFGQVRKIHYAK